MALAFDIATLPETPRGLTDLTVDGSDLGDKIRGWCGLFVFIKHDQLYLIHQTAREFLMSKREDQIDSSDTWKHCLCPRDIDMKMAEICVAFLCLSDFDAAPPDAPPDALSDDDTQPQDGVSESTDCDADQWSEDRRFGIEHVIRDNINQGRGSDIKTFFNFASEHWASYVRRYQADFDNQVQCQIQMLYDSKSNLFRRWTRHTSKRVFLYGLGLFDVRSGVHGVHIASFNGHYRVLQVMLSSDQNLVNKSNSDGKTPLIWGIAGGHRQTIELLVAQPGIDVNLGEPLACAAKSGYKEIVELLVAHPGIDVNLGEPLVWAARHGNKEIVELLVAHPGIDINTGWPLSTAAEHGHKEIAELLLAQLDIDFNLGKPLAWAARHGYKEIAELLVAKPGIHVNTREPLSEAASAGYIKVVQLLVAQPDIDVTLGKPLSEAAFHGNKEIVELLVAQPGIDVNIGKPLAQAAYGGHKETVELLLAQSGIDVNLEDPLSWAAELGREEIVKLLLARPDVLKTRRYWQTSGRGMTTSMEVFDWESPDDVLTARSENLSAWESENSEDEAPGLRRVRTW